MTQRKFIVTLAVIMLVFTLVTIIASSVTNVANTIISNHLAVGQLENDDAGYILMELYNNLIRPCGSIILVCVYITLIALMLLNIVKYIKFSKNRKEVTLNEKDN